jgi:hypothetical protein
MLAALHRALPRRRILVTRRTRRTAKEELRRKERRARHGYTPLLVGANRRRPASHWPRVPALRTFLSPGCLGCDGRLSLAGGIASRNHQEDLRDELNPPPPLSAVRSHDRRRARDGSPRLGVGPCRVEIPRSLVRLLSQTHHRPRLPVRARTLTKRELAGAEPTCRLRSRWQSCVRLRPAGRARDLRIALSASARFGGHRQRTMALSHAHSGPRARAHEGVAGRSAGEMGS